MKKVKILVLLLSSLLIYSGGSARAGTKGSLANKAVASKPIDHTLLLKGVNAYVEIADALAADNLAVAKKAAVVTKEVFDQLAKQSTLDISETFAQVAKEAETFNKSTDIAAARENFKPLSKAIIGYVSKDEKLRSNFHLYLCPMATGFGKWMQAHDKVKNPFYGTKMQTCGSKEDWKI